MVRWRSVSPVPPAFVPGVCVLSLMGANVSGIGTIIKHVFDVSPVESRETRGRGICRCGDLSSDTLDQMFYIEHMSE